MINYMTKTSWPTLCDRLHSPLMSMPSTDITHLCALLSRPLSFSHTATANLCPGGTPSSSLYTWESSSPNREPRYVSGHSGWDWNIRVCVETALELMSCPLSQPLDSSKGLSHQMLTGDFRRKTTKKTNQCLKCAQINLRGAYGTYTLPQHR